MKKKITILLLIALSLVCALCACKKKGDTPAPNPTDIVKPELTLNKTSAQMIYGDTLELIANHNEVDGATLSWTTEDASVATVSDGTVTAVGIGFTRIKVSYGNENKYCSVLVVYGDIQPTLVIKSLNNGISLYKGDRYEVKGEVMFNSKSYPCELMASVSDDKALSFDSSTNELIANEVGRFTATFYTEWNGFKGALLSVDAEVNVSIPLYTEIRVVRSDSDAELTDKLDLWTSDYWVGNSYDNEATLRIEAFYDGQKLDDSTISCEVGDESLARYDAATGKIIVNSDGLTGETTLFVSAKYGEYLATTPVTISVSCPIADYTDLIEYSAYSGPVNKKWKDVFGDGYKITAAYQGDEILTVNSEKGLLNGLKVNGTDTEPFVVQSLNGGFRFTNVDAYSAVLTESNIFSITAPANRNSGYYVMKGDITKDFTERANGNWYNCFLGTFDGRGHTLNATVGGYGVFGSLGNGAVIKNTRFNFTFSGSGANLAQYDISLSNAYCGLAANNDNMLEGYAQNKGEYHVTLDNLRVTTTNYKKNSFALMGVKPFFLHMNDILVELNGLEGYAYSDASTDSSALFGADRTGAMTGYADTALNRIKAGNLVTNVYFVTQKFMPVSAFTTATSKRTFVWYAGNDVKALGKTEEEASLRLTSKNGEDFANKKYFGSIWGVRSLTTYNPYILRYDTAADLKASGVEKVGTWSV